MAKNTSRILFEQMHEFSNLLRRQHHKMVHEQMRQGAAQEEEGRECCGRGPHGRGPEGFGGRTQGRVLDMLMQNGEMSQKELAEALRIRPSSVSELISKLEVKGYIKRTINEEDKRVSSIGLTEEGEKEAQQAAERMNSRVEPMFEALNAEEQEQLSILMGKLIVSMDAATADEACAAAEDVCGCGAAHHHHHHHAHECGDGHKHHHKEGCKEGRHSGQGCGGGKNHGRHHGEGCKGGHHAHHRNG